MCEATLAPSSVETSDKPATPTIGDIFRQVGPPYRRKHSHRMNSMQRQAMALIESCRTGELGTVCFHCENCGQRHSVPRSCGNRHCPVCQGHKARTWLERQLDKLLPCPYFLVTFTIPKELRKFVRSHRREGYKALFDTAAATLIELARNPKFVGPGQLGFTGVLHSWGRTLCYHPHVHFIVPGGAIHDDGQSWLASRVDFLIPVHAASKIFRGKFKARMEELGLLHQIPQAVWRKRWIVHSKAVGDGRRALGYLAPYVFRVAISNRRIVKLEPGPEDDPLSGHLTFSYRQSGSRRYRKMRVTTEEFVRRFLQHVLPRGFQKVRHYGFAHPRSKVDPQWLKMLVTTSLNLVYTLIVQGQPPRVPFQPTCPDCGGRLICTGMVLAEDLIPRENSCWHVLDTTLRGPPVNRIAISS